MIKKYRKKPVVIEAIQWDGTNNNEVLDFCDKAEFQYVIRKPKNIFSNKRERYVMMALFIQTFEGLHEASIGDYIIEGVNGEFYPCKQDIFKKTYEEVET